MSEMSRSDHLETGDKERINHADMEYVLRNFVLNDRPLCRHDDIVISVGDPDEAHYCCSNPRYSLGMHEPMLKPLPSGNKPVYARGWSIIPIPKLSSMNVRVGHDPTREEHAAFRLLLLLLDRYRDGGTGWAHDVALREIGALLRNVREQAGLDTTSVAEIVGLTQDAFEKFEMGIERAGAKTLRDWCGAIGILCRPDKPIIRLVDLSPRILQLLRRDPAELRNLSPSQFEQFVGERLQAMGYDVVLTGATHRKDGGIDLIGVSKAGSVPHIIAAQVKHHRESTTKTSRESVDRLLAWKNRVFSLGLLVTNTEFTRDAIWLASQHENKAFLRLRNFFHLKRWLEDCFNEMAEYDELPEHIDLAPDIRVHVPRPRLFQG